MILVDTNVIVALADRSDTAHALCRRWLEEQTDQLAVPITILAEACYLIDRFGGPTAEAQFLDSVGSEPPSDTIFSGRLTKGQTHGRQLSRVSGYSWSAPMRYMYKPQPSKRTVALWTYP